MNLTNIVNIAITKARAKSPPPASAPGVDMAITRAILDAYKVTGVNPHYTHATFLINAINELLKDSILSDEIRLFPDRLAPKSRFEHLLTAKLIQTLRKEVLGIEEAPPIEEEKEAPPPTLKEILTQFLQDLEALIDRKIQSYFELLDEREATKERQLIEFLEKESL